VLQKFNIVSPLTPHFKLTTKQCPTSDKEEQEMEKVSYASVVGSLMYVIVCNISDIAHAVVIVSHFLSNPDKEH